MALARLNLPGLLLYGGSIMPGVFEGHDVTVLDVFEAVGAHAAGKMTAERLRALEHVACPGAGACGGQYTANTMAMATEMMGISLVDSASVPAMDPKKDEVAYEVGRVAVDLLRSNLRPRDVITQASLENAIASVLATGGSTNAVLHLLAIAREADVELSIDDFDRISRTTPIIADLKPGGQYVANDLYEAGGVRLVANRHAAGRHPAPEPMTVTGRTHRRGGAHGGGEARPGRRNYC